MGSPSNPSQDATDWKSNYSNSAVASVQVINPLHQIKTQASNINN